MTHCNYLLVESCERNDKLRADNKIYIDNSTIGIFRSDRHEIDILMNMEQYQYERNFWQNVT